MNFLLLNRDIPVLSFNISTVVGICTVGVGAVYREDLIPIALRSKSSLQGWIEDRLILTHRKNVQNLFRSLGIADLEYIVDCTNCISLLDCYWVKDVNSNLSWKNVSPYRNPLNSVIANYSYESGRKIDRKHITRSPDFSTKGDFPKCWRKINGYFYLYKAGSKGFVNAGKEPYSEVYASILANAMGIEHVEYELVEYRGVTASRCKNICSEEIGMVSIADYDISVQSYSDLLSKAYIKGLSNRGTLISMLLLDYLTLNTDRHFNNISLLVDNSNQSILGLAPIYDNNLAFLPYFYRAVDVDVKEYIIKNDDLAYAFDGSTFDDMLKMISCKNVKDMVRNLVGFRFKTIMPYDDIKNGILQYQLCKACKVLGI